MHDAWKEFAVHSPGQGVLEPGCGKLGWFGNDGRRVLGGGGCDAWGCPHICWCEGYSCSHQVLIRVRMPSGCGYIESPNCRTRTLPGGVRWGCAPCAPRQVNQGAQAKAMQVGTRFLWASCRLLWAAASAGRLLDCALHVGVRVPAHAETRVPRVAQRTHPG